MFRNIRWKWLQRNFGDILRCNLLKKVIHLGIYWKFGIQKVFFCMKTKDHFKFGGLWINWNIKFWKLFGVICIKLQAWLEKNYFMYIKNIHHVMMQWMFFSIFQHFSNNSRRSQIPRQKNSVKSTIKKIHCKHEKKHSSNFISLYNQFNKKVVHWKVHLVSWKTISTLIKIFSNFFQQLFHNNPPEKWKTFSRFSICINFSMRIHFNYTTPEHFWSVFLQLTLKINLLHKLCPVFWHK